MEIFEIKKLRNAVFGKVSDDNDDDDVDDDDDDDDVDAEDNARRVYRQNASMFERPTNSFLFEIVTTISVRKRKN